MRYGEKEGMNPFEGGEKDRSEEGRGKAKRKKAKRKMGRHMKMGRK